MARLDDYGFLNNTFIYPYNFVSINKEKTDRSIDAEDEKKDVHTGRLHCLLTVKTPLIIPDIENVEEDKNAKDHKVYSAFRINNRIAIPGSSIRGMLRSVFEAATNSCMPTMNPDEHITKRSDIGKFEPCILKKDNNGMWKLYRAKRIALVCSGENYCKLDGNYQRFVVKLDGKEKYIESKSKRLYFGQEVQIRINPIGHEKYDKRKGTKREVWDNKTVGAIEEGNGTNRYLYLGEANFSKHAESVFEITGKTPERFDSKSIVESMQKLEETLNMYRSESINRNLSSDKPRERHYGYYGYERAKKNGVIPLWYCEDGNNLKLSMAAMGRIAFSNNMEKISNQHAPCVSRKKLCPACAVFGMVGKGKDEENKGVGSSIRITDAIGNATIKTQKNVTLKELGTPRTSYLQFYSENGKTYDEKGAVIRGRKFYWHIPNAINDSSIYSTKDKTKRNATYELINKDSTFEFDVYYEKLNMEQLKMLLWSIELPNKFNDNRTLMHKLGHGKPLGLGSVEIKVLSNIERYCMDGYKIIDSDIKISHEEKPQLLDNTSWQQLNVLLEFNPNSKEKIAYPTIRISNDVQRMLDKRGEKLKDNVKASHQWFKNNKEQLPYGRKGMRELELKNVSDRDLSKH